MASYQLWPLPTVIPTQYLGGLTYQFVHAGIQTFPSRSKWPSFFFVSSNLKDKLAISKSSFISYKTQTCHHSLKILPELFSHPPTRTHLHTYARHIKIAGKVASLKAVLNSLTVMNFRRLLTIPAMQINTSPCTKSW